MKKLQRLVILGATALSLTGCAWHNSGPCFGVGCPTWASATAPHATASNTAPAAAGSASAQSAAPANTSAAPAPKASKGEFAKMFTRVKGVFSPQAKTASSNTAAPAPAGTTSGR